MNKQELMRDMKSEIGSFPNQSQIARYLGKSRDYVREMMNGVEYLGDGKSKKYFVGDVANKMLERRKV